MSRKYRDVINLLRDSAGDGDQTPNYVTESSGYPCKIIPKSAYEARRDRQLEASVTNVIELRWYDGFKPNDIVEDALTGTRYYIKGIIDVLGDSRHMEIHCTEVVV